MRFFLLNVLFFTSIFDLYAQALVEIKCRVVREDTQEGVFGVAVFNRNSLLGTTSNKNGEFLMRVKPGDTLQLTHINYYTELVIFFNTDFDLSQFILIKIKQRDYQLTDQHVVNFRLRERYRTAPFTMRRTDNMTFDLGPIRMENTTPIYQSMGLGYMPAMGAGIPDFKEMRRQEQLAKIKELESKINRNRAITSRYSRQRVQELTGLKGNELENFMNYCRPSEKIVLAGSEYELTHFILDCYQKFREDQD